MGPTEVAGAGPTRLRGLPFLLGRHSGEGTQYLVFGEGHTEDPVEMEVNRPACWVIFAHRLLESHIAEGEPVGRRVASYHFGYEDGSEVVVPIRERLEIGTAPSAWGQWPLLAVADRRERLMPRFEGRWEMSGVRQAEVTSFDVDQFYLWPWLNPHPDRCISVIRVEPEDRPFVVAGITLSALEEDPFGRGPMRPIKLTMLDVDRARRPFDLTVEVDRGVAGYPFPLPVQTSEEFEKDPFRGWGQEYNKTNSPAYVEIAAQPSATVDVKQGDETLAAVSWAEVTERGAVESAHARIELVDRGKNWVRVTVLDEDTDRPVPCRVHFRSPEGIPYQPHGHHNHIHSDLDSWHVDVGGDLRLGHVTYAYIDGTCEGWLPRGRVTVDVARGFEYEPLRTSVPIEPGQRELTLRLRRWTNMNAQRWFSGDSHVHFLSTLGAQREALGEDLDVVNLLQSQWGHLFTNTEDFLGRPISTLDGGTIVYTSQENRQHFLGHLTLLGLQRAVMPWGSGGPDEAEMGGTLEVAMSHWADACHAQGGTVIIPHLPNPNGEPAALIATGRADAVEFLTHTPYAHLEYYRYLNGGYRLPLVGGTDKMTSDVPVGLYRTYVYIPADEEFNYENWCKNLRHGRTFLSGGPMLHFRVEGAMPGDTLALSGGGGSVEVEAEAESTVPIHTLQVVQGGRVVASAEELKGTRRLSLRTTLSIDRHAWLAARVGGPGYDTAVPFHDGWHRGVMAHTSPVYVAVNEPWQLHSEETRQYMLTLVHGGIEYIRQRARLHPPGTVTHHHGERDHEAFLVRPFQEALDALKNAHGNPE
jgi:hypothetical protein